ncbi:S8 family peptidase [Cytobacillus depressus]|nr:S8 family serine peptidase [Cytobacillus depressus]
MKKPFFKVVSVLSSAFILGMGVSQPAMGQAFTKSGSVVAPVNKQLERQTEKEQVPLLSDEVLVVKYKTPLSQSELQRSGLVLMNHFPSLKTAVVKLKDKKKMDTVIRSLSKQDHVVSIHPSARYKTLGSGDPKAAEQYYLQMLNMDKAHSLAGKNKVRIAVIDQGIDMDHPELKGKLLPSYNAVNPMSAGMADFHGTHVAGIIASEKGNGIGGYGINPNAEILPIDVFDRSYWASDYALAQGILHAIEKKAKVINLSLGGPYPSQLIKDAVKKAVDQGIVVVAAAGNTGDETLSYPASFEGVISVGNIDEKKKRAFDSSYGPAIDLVAPGENIYNAIYEFEKKSSFRKMSGTSMASPIVAGTASLLLSKNPSLKPAEIEYILKHSADDLGPKGYDIEYGYGLVNPVKALQFDPKKIPDYIRNGNFARDKAIEKAELIDVQSKKTITSELTKPQQENWVKIQVKAGQTLQLQLSGGDQFDYKLVGKWLNSKKEGFELNEVRHGLPEGSVLHIEEDGVLALGVMDVHGQYDDTGNKKSTYGLSITLTDKVPQEESSITNPTVISTLPAKITDHTLFAPNGEKDEDYYSLKVTEPQTVKISIGGLPGVDSSIKVYQKMSATELPADMQPSDSLVPIKYENRKGKSEGETLLFAAEPNVEYVVQISNQPDFVFGYYEFFMDPSLIDNQQKPKSSLDPYELRVEGFVLPEDEDQFSMGAFLGGEQSGLAIEQKMMDPVQSYLEMERNYTEMIKSIAIPVSSGITSGYLQVEGDQDWYQVVAEADGLYKLDLSKGALKPAVEVSQIMTEKVKDEEYEYFSYIGNNHDWWTWKVKDEIYLSLEKGKTYYIRIEADYWNNSGISVDPYQFELKKIADIKKDSYEPNDTYEEAKDINTTRITANFGKANDTDIYYFKAKESAVYGLSVNPLEVTKQLKDQYPESVLQPFNSFAVIYEDKNKNRKLDEEEMETAQYFQKGIYLGKTFGSFKAKKDAHYFIAVSGFFQSNTNFSLRPYELTVQPIVSKDEDPYNTGVSLNKIKPMKMTKESNTKFAVKGYFNPVDYGDEDWYAFTMPKNGKASITLEVPKEIDGQIEIYQNGKLLKKADYYPEGDAEVLHMNLNKGEYWIKLKEAYNQTSIEPYKLIVQIQ